MKVLVPIFVAVAVISTACGSDSHNGSKNREQSGAAEQDAEHSSKHGSSKHGSSNHSGNHSSSHKAHSKSEDAAIGAESCILSMNGAEVCYESSISIKTECTIFGNKYQAKQCDKSRYDKKCTSTVLVSVDDGPETEETELHYYKADSDYGCFGTEEDL